MDADEPRAAAAPPAVASVEILHRGWCCSLQVALGDGRTQAHEVKDHGSAASVLHYDPERQITLLVRQLRAPAGLVEAEAAGACVRREALEDIGARLGALEPITRT